MGAKATPERFILFAPYVLEALFTTFPVRIEALRDPGVRLGKCLIATLNEYDTNNVLMRKVFSGLDSKQAAVRAECASYVEFIIQRIPLLEKDVMTEDEKALLSEIDAAVRKACKDASSEARMHGYRACKRYTEIAPNAQKEIVDKMTKAQMKKYDEANAAKYAFISNEE